MSFSAKSAQFYLKNVFTFLALCCSHFSASSTLDDETFFIFSLNMALLPGGGKFNVQHILFIAVSPIPVAKLHCAILIFISELQHIFLLVFMMVLVSQIEH